MKDYQAIDELKQNILASQMTFVTLNQLLKAIRLLPIRKSIKILDIGCGTGFWLEFIAQRKKNIQLVGIDLLGDCFDKRICKRHSQIKFIRADALQLPFKDEGFDLVYSLDVIEHFSTEKDVNRFLKEAYRVLRPGGLLVIQTPNRRRLSMRFRELLGKRNWPYHLGTHKVLGEVTHYREYTKKELEKVVKEGGFEKIKTSYLWLGLASPGNARWGFEKFPKIFGPLAQLLFSVAQKTDKL